MAQPIYNYVFPINANTDPITKNKGILITCSSDLNGGQGTTGSAVVGFFDSNGETSCVSIGVSAAAGVDGVAGITQEFFVNSGSQIIIPIRVGNVGVLTNCEVKGLN